MHMFYVTQIFILIVVITSFVTFLLTVNTNIMTGYTYIPVIVLLHVLPGLQYPIASCAKVQASPIHNECTVHIY